MYGKYVKSLSNFLAEFSAHIVERLLESFLLASNFFFTGFRQEKESTTSVSMSLLFDENKVSYGFSSMGLMDLVCKPVGLILTFLEEFSFSSSVYAFVPIREWDVLTSSLLSVSGVAKTLLRGFKINF